MKIFDNTLGKLERSLDVRLVRHNVLAGNVANLDTPGFRPKDIDFSSAMAALDGRPDGTDGVRMAVTESGHLERGATAGSDGPSALDAKDLPVVDVPAGNASLDGNGVDLDRTMAAMAENALQYGASARAASRKLAILKYVTSDGS